MNARILSHVPARAALSVLVAAALMGAAAETFAQAAVDKLQRGRYLVNTSGCHDYLRTVLAIDKRVPVPLPVAAATAQK